MEKTTTSKVFLDTDGYGFDKFQEDCIANGSVASLKDMLDWYDFDTNLRIEDTIDWLYQETEYPILAFADFGFWNGRSNGAIKYGNNVADIIDLKGQDRGIFYCDQRNVKADLIHHDGTHHLTFRMAKNDNVVDKIMELARSGKLTYEYFLTNTISIYKVKPDLKSWLTPRVQ